MLTLLAALALHSSDFISAVSPPIELVRVEGHGRMPGFAIGKYEITQDQFEDFISATQYDGSDKPSSKPSESFLQDWAGGKPKPGFERFPVAYVNWHHAKAFCRWLSKKAGRSIRLPSDAEWTLAASGLEGRTYPWADEWDSRKCNWGGDDDGFSEAAPVGSFPRGATPTGIHDMAGNIWEWSAEGNLRGGPWCMGPESVKAATIAREDQDRCDDKFGLRIVVKLPSSR
jgi:serine/threonine-protein kinase